MLSILIFTLAISVLIYARLIKRKAVQVDSLTKIVYTDFNNNSKLINESRDNIIDSLALGIGSSGLNLLDIYASVEDHETVVETLAQRFPDAIKDFSSLDWFKKVSELNANDSMASYISAFKGQAAENISLEFLQEQGYENARPFSSLTHANDDVVAELNGEEISLSVKNGSVDYIKGSISDHPLSTNYIVNEESYNEMLNSGDIDEYADEGITILNGGYSVDELTEQGQEALEDIFDAGDILDDIPWIALAIFGVKTVKNVKQYKSCNQSKYEFGVNVAVDAGRVAAGGLMAAGGAQIGTALGTMVAPGIGSIVGAGIGVVVGALAGGQLFNKIKERLKWGAIIDALDHFGEKYGFKYSSQIESNIKNELFNYNDIKNNINKEQKLVNKYEKEMNPFSIKKPSLESVMVYEHINNLEKSKKRIDTVTRKAAAKVRKFTDNIVFKGKENETKSNKMQKVSRRIATDILLGNRWLFNKESLSDDDKKILREFDEKVLLAPNHPYSLNADPIEVFKGIIYKAYDDVDNVHMNSVKIIVNIMNICGIALLVISIYSYFTS